MKRTISKENTFMVAILTKTGATFNEEGVDFVQNWLSEQYPELKDRAIIAMMGEMVYKPNKLATMLEANPDMFIVMSYNGGEYISMVQYDADHAVPVIKMLREVAEENPDEISWNVFKSALKEVE